ncbi:MULTISPECIES: Dabb family protein [Paenibacillus]|uniref:Dabb family protein n=1 Tax=Paenibacillus TaxID=44249 RepID=UPI0022B8729B|nr:Dabb family protein [Paenibacillus caseinilyticus]MCZ8521204.1 Dabb family protein [Paenibacillus caseinilyticus]
MNEHTIRHSVIFCLKHAAGSPEAQRFLEDGRAALTSIPGVERFEVFRQVSPKNEYEYGFSMDFSDAAAYEAYNLHPVHTAFVSERWEKEVTRFLEIDYKTATAGV